MLGWGIPTGACSPLPLLQLESLPYDERPLPAIHKQPGPTAVEPEKSDTDDSEAPRAGAAGEPEPLAEKALREASSVIEVLGETLVRGKHQTHVCVCP